MKAFHIITTCIVAGLLLTSCGTNQGGSTNTNNTGATIPLVSGPTRIVTDPFGTYDLHKLSIKQRNAKLIFYRKNNIKGNDLDMSRAKQYVQVMREEMKRRYGFEGIENGTATFHNGITCKALVDNDYVSGYESCTNADFLNTINNFLQNEE